VRQLLTLLTGTATVDVTALCGSYWHRWLVQLLLILPLCAAATDIADWYSYCWYYWFVR